MRLEKCPFVLIRNKNEKKKRNRNEPTPLVLVSLEHERLQADRTTALERSSCGFVLLYSDTFFF